MWLPHLLHMFLPRDGQNSTQRVEDVLCLIHNTSPLLFLRPEVKFDITYIIVTLALLSSYSVNDGAMCYTCSDMFF